MLRPTTPRKVNFADASDIKNCNTCDSTFSIVCLKHTCNSCNKDFCGKCSKSNVTTISNTLVRERLCNNCTNQRFEAKPQFTPSKLRLLDEYDNAASKLWSADSESDCDSDEENSESQKRENIVGHCLSKEFITDQENSGTMNMPCLNEAPPTDKQHITSNFNLTPAQHKLLRSLCDASFSDNASGASSVSSKAASSAAKSPAGGVSGNCVTCLTVFDDNSRRHMCSHCTRWICGGCSTSQLLVRDATVLRHRVCRTCEPVLADAPFTPGKLHLLNQQPSMGTGSVLSHRRHLQNRLWSADTDSDSDDSSPGSACEETEDVDPVVESVAENLFDDIQGEETNKELVTDEIQSQECECKQSEKTSTELDISWVLDGPTLLDELKSTRKAAVLPEPNRNPVASMSRLNNARDFSQAIRAPLLVLLLALCVVISTTLWASGSASMAPFGAAERTVAHVPSVPRLTLTSAPAAVERLPSPAPEDAFRDAPVPLEENKLTPTKLTSAKALTKKRTQRTRIETKVTMLLYSPPVALVSNNNKQSTMEKHPQTTNAVTANATAIRIHARLRAVFHKCWREVKNWAKHAHASSMHFFTRLVSVPRQSVK